MYFGIIYLQVRLAPFETLLERGGIAPIAIEIGSAGVSALVLAADGG